MRIELKSVDYSKQMSEETSCFSAQVYIDGRRVGSVLNHGHGGCHQYTGEAEAILSAHAKGLPKVQSDLVDETDPSGFFCYAPDADSLIDEALETYLMTRDLKRHLASKILFTKKGEPGIYQSGKLTPGQKNIIKTNPSWVRTQMPSADKILNLLPFDEALALYRSSI